MEKIHPETFVWLDAHWMLGKAELEARAAEWNAALNQCCNEKESTGSERDDIVARDTANPLAPCARVGCDKRVRLK